MTKKKSLIGTPELLPWLPPGKAKEETFNQLAHKKNSGLYDLSASNASQIWATSASQKPSIESSPWSIRKWSNNSNKKASIGSERERRISELLNASHNSQAERDFLRGKILDIFEEDERGKSQMDVIKEEEDEKEGSDRKRKHGRNKKSGDGRRKRHNSESDHRKRRDKDDNRKHHKKSDRSRSEERAKSKDDEGFVEGHHEEGRRPQSGVKRRGGGGVPVDSGTGSAKTATSGIGSDDLEERTSIQFIDSYDATPAANNHNRANSPPGFHERGYSSMQLVRPRTPAENGHQYGRHSLQHEPPGQWQLRDGHHKSNDMVIVDDLEDPNNYHNGPFKKNSVVQTVAMTPWVHQHQEQQTHFAQGKSSQTDSYNMSVLDNSFNYGHSPPPAGFHSIHLDRSQRHSQNSQPISGAWVIFPKESGDRSMRNFTARPVNFAESVGSRLKQSFANINRSTPVESIANAPLLNSAEDNDGLTPEERLRKKRRQAALTGAAVGGGALLLATVLVGGTLLGTQGDASATGGNLNSAGFFPGYSYNNDTGPCNQYTTLTDSWRLINGLGPSSTNKKYNCDTPRPDKGQKGIKEGWHRFMGAAGTHMATKPLDTGSGAREVCGTSIVGWMNGEHPLVHHGVVTRQFCFEYVSGPCQFAVRSQVRTCVDPENTGATFYVYLLKYPQEIICNWAYCAQ